MFGRARVGRHHAVIPALTVHLCWHLGGDPRCAAIGKELYEFLHRGANDHPVHRPGLEIPVEYGRELGTLVEAIEGETPRLRVIVMILDGIGFADERFRAAVARAASAATCVAVVVDGAWGADVKGIEVVAAGDEAGRGWRIGAAVGVVVGRALEAEGRPRVFVSHTDEDGALLARRLTERLREEDSIDAERYLGGADRGDRLADKLTAAGARGVLVIVRTDRYAEDTGCFTELVAAKRAMSAIVTVLATRAGEVSAPAYGGNHRTVTWDEPRADEVIGELVGRCVQAWLHAHHFRAHATVALAHAGLPADARIVTRRPELFDLTSPPGPPGRNILVYPDPPLPENEASLLRISQPSLRLVTPNTMLGRVLLANDPRPPLAGCEIALSLSRADDLRELGDDPDGSGLTQAHVDDVMYTLVLHALHSGARLAYGGDLRIQQGFARSLAELHVARRRLGVGERSQLVCFFDDTTRRPDGDRAPVEYRAVNVAHLADPVARAPAVRDALWHLHMRHVMAQRSEARIILGGKRRPAVTDDRSDPGYIGPWSGYLEEAARTLLADKALYVVGGFGGWAGELARKLLDRAEPRDAPGPVPPRLATLTAQVDEARIALAGDGAAGVLLVEDGLPLGAAQLEALVTARWRRFAEDDQEHRSSWDNGLDLAANRRLMTSTDRTEIAQLIFQGLRERVRRRPAGATPALTVSLYHGNLASVDRVDAYAVTTVDGLPIAGGAMGALDRAMSGRLHRRFLDVRRDGAAVTNVPVETDVLAGQHALIAHLALPAAGAVTAGTVRALAAQIGQACNVAGIESLAVVPFAARLGLAAGEAVRAFLDGLADARGSGEYPSRVVVCERDRRRYEAVKQALDGRPNVDELRGGPMPATHAPTVALHVAGAAGDDGGVTLQVTAFPPDGAAALVPSDHVRVPALAWDALRRRPDDPDARRRELRAVLPAGVLGLLDGHADHRLLVVADRLASGLPWECLAPSAGDALAMRGGVLRRVAVSDAIPSPPDRASTDHLLKVLVVVDPRRNLPIAATEDAAVKTALGRRASVEVTVLRHDEATVERVCDELRVGYHDVLHYAGHARFDEDDVARSGLELADDVLTARVLRALRDDRRVRLPRLVVLGACQSVRLRGVAPESSILPERVEGTLDFPFAQELLRQGVATLVGTFFDVEDGAAATFAGVLYATLAGGKAIGDAVIAGRRALHTDRKVDWCSFAIYGDDTLTL